MMDMCVCQMISANVHKKTKSNSRLKALIELYAFINYTFLYNFIFTLAIVRRVYRNAIWFETLVIGILMWY